MQTGGFVFLPLPSPFLLKNKTKNTNEKRATPIHRIKPTNKLQNTFMMIADGYKKY